MTSAPTTPLTKEEPLCDCPGAGALSTHGSGDGRRYCDFCGLPVWAKGEEPKSPAELEALLASKDALLLQKDALLQAATEALAEREWRPIESAPKDGTGVIAFVPGFGMGTFCLYWTDGYWREPANGLGLKVEPTHWMPLPAAPRGRTQC